MIEQFNKIKNKNYHTVGTYPNSKNNCRNMQNRCPKHKNECSLTFL